MAETEPTEAKTPEGKSGKSTPSAARVFLVVIDDTPELKLAIRYACVRAGKPAGGSPCCT